MLELKNVCKKYDRDVLKKINLKFGNKGFICLVGESGSGKTTLLNILSSFIPDNERIITIEDAAELKLEKEHVISLETRVNN